MNGGCRRMIFMQNIPRAREWSIENYVSIRFNVQLFTFTPDDFVFFSLLAIVFVLCYSFRLFFFSWFPPVLYFYYWHCFFSVFVFATPLPILSAPVRRVFICAFMREQTSHRETRIHSIPGPRSLRWAANSKQEWMKPKSLRAPCFFQLFRFACSSIVPFNGHCFCPEEKKRCTMDAQQVRTHTCDFPNQEL